MTDTSQVVYRKEIKYVIKKSDFEKIAEKLAFVLEKDKNGKNGSYTVRSQYYDSIGNRDLYDNLDGVLEKRKIRVRIYSTKDKTAKLEYKTKSGGDGVKFSIKITKKEAKKMENRDFGFLLEHEDPMAKQLYIKLLQYTYIPRSIVEYDRIAYKHDVGRMRITFDTNVRGSIVPYGIFSNDLTYVPLMDYDEGILEIKYNGFLPAIFKGLIQEIDRLPQANSKYTQSRKYI